MVKKYKIGLVVPIFVEQEYHVEVLRKFLFNLNFVDYSIAIINRDTMGCGTILSSFDKYLLHEKNCVAGAWNIGIRECCNNDCDFILVLNMDTLIKGDTIEQLIDMLTIRPQCVLATAYGGEDLSGILPLHKHPRANTFNCFMVRRDFLDKLGHFDEGFEPAYGEDDDILYRIYLAGFESLCNTNIRVSHLGSYVLNSSKKSKEQMAGKSLRYFLDKWGSFDRTQYFKYPFNNPNFNFKYTTQYDTTPKAN
jgi:hypothetical protein